MKPQVLCGATRDLPSVMALARGGSSGLVRAGWPSEAIWTLSSACIQAAVNAAQVGTTAFPRSKFSGLALPLSWGFLSLRVACKPNTSSAADYR